MQRPVFATSLLLALLAGTALPTQAAVSVSVSVSGSATTIGFTKISSNAPENVAGQLSVQVQKATISDSGADNVFQPGEYQNANAIRFTFLNTGDIASRISQIYFDDGRYLREPKLIAQGTGTNFAFDANPAHPPEIDPNSWTTTSSLYAADQSGAAENGLDNFDGSEDAEWVSVTYRLRTLADGDYQEYKKQGNNLVPDGPIDPARDVTYEQALAALLHGDINNDPLEPFRIALHVTGIGDTGDSDAYIINPVPAGGGTGGGQGQVPEPATLAIWGLGLGIASLVRLRRKS